MRTVGVPEETFIPHETDAPLVVPEEQPAPAEPVKEDEPVPA